MTKTERDERNLKMKMLYIKNDFTYLDIARKFKVNENTVQKIAVQNDWQQEKKKLLDEADSIAMTQTLGRLSLKKEDVNVAHYTTWEKFNTIVNEILDDPDTYLKYENGIYKIGTIERLAVIFDKVQNGQRVATGLASVIDLKKLALTQQKLDLESKKASGEVIVPQNDGFIEAMKSTVADIWGDEDGEA